MFDKLKDIWDNHGFTILVCFSIALIVIYGLFRIAKKEKGTWDKNHDYYVPSSSNSSTSSRKGIPRESKGELECRRVLEKLFNKPFNKSRPDFLNNPVTGGNFNLELDCYNQELKLAVEYNGIQHYKYNKFFHRNNEHFLNQKYRDELKKRMCKDNGIILIEVPYSIKPENIEGYLRNKLRTHAFDV